MEPDLPDATPTGLPAPDAPGPDELRPTLAGFATGVTVVTVAGDNPHGMTANAFASVSLDPPLVLLCVGRGAKMHGYLSVANCFGVSVLGVDQQETARYFASRRRPEGGAQFRQVDWWAGGRTGAPLIGGAIAWLECRRWAQYDGGDHSIFVGQVLTATRGSSGEPLVFFDSGFRRLAAEVRS